MGRNRRYRTKATKSDNPNHRFAQMVLALPGLAPSGQQDAPMEHLPSLDPLDGAPVEQGRPPTAPLSVSGTPPPGDSRARVDPCDPPSAPPSQVGDPAIGGSACILCPPLALDQQDAAVPSPSRRFTLDSLLQLAKVVETLREKASAERAIADEDPGVAKRRSGRTGNGGVQSAAPTPRIRSGTACPPTCPAGDPELPPAQWEREE
jgi:hypothetical protein